MTTIAAIAIEPSAEMLCEFTPAGSDLFACDSLTRANVLNRTDGGQLPGVTFQRPGAALMENSAMLTRRRVKQIDSLEDRLIQQANKLRRKAKEMPPGGRREGLLKKAREAEMAARIDDWLSSPGLPLPE
jgi:hypothetical protein